MKSFLKSLTKLNPFFAGSKWLSSAAVLGGNGWGLSETLLPGLETGAPAPLSARWLGTEDPLLTGFDTGALACDVSPRIAGLGRCAWRKRVRVDGVTSTGRCMYAAVTQ